MVKNVKGGSGHKGQARKFVVPASSKQIVKTRVALEDGELYAQVTKMLGNGMCHVLCQDNKTRLCFIRGKFRGRGKRDNMISNGRWILVGLRDYESEKACGKLDNCDLLDVYSDQDKERLKNQIQTVNWNQFILNDRVNTNTNDGVDDGFDFTDEKEDEYKKIMEMDISSKKINLNLKIEKEKGDGDDDREDEINIDDI
uniref:S1-like domain-containing protein n=1 Tax=viral metagenome TaxID=1070528 RepID=A0A6C0BXJ6_9ZZZZ